MSNNAGPGKVSSRMASIRGARLSSIRGKPMDDSAALQKQKPVLLQHGLMVIDTIASGGQGEVLKANKKQVSATSDDTTYTPVAIKYIRCQNEKEREETMKEVGFLKKIRHPNVVSLIDVIEDRNAVYVVTELLNGGDLLDRIQEGAFSEAQVLYFAEKVLSILVDIHKDGISHRDLKLENFMLHTDPVTNEETIKLIDLGMAYERGKNDDPLISNEHPGTLSYEAPEIVKRIPYSPEKVDIWCTGVMLYTATQKTYPFPGGEDQSEEVHRMICDDKPKFDGPEWNQLTDFKRLITRMLDKRASWRPSASEALAIVQKIRKAKQVQAAGRRAEANKQLDEPVRLAKKEGFFVRLLKAFKKKTPA